MSTYAPVELNPDQAIMLVNAWRQEQARLRHLAEKWEGETRRDGKRRDLFIRQAVEKGVPLPQAHAFVYSGPVD